VAEPVRVLPVAAIPVWTLLSSAVASGDGAPQTAPLHASEGDGRIRVSEYSADRIYSLAGYAGYQIDVQFEPGENFVGLGAGDLAGLGFAAHDNHLFIKPRAAEFVTNLTVLTTRRSYQFEYRASAHRPDLADGQVIYALRFTYPAAPAAASAAGVERALRAAQARPRNLAYGYRGNPALKPESAWDDGVHTQLRFGAHSELPAIFVRSDDGSESLVNFSIEGGEVLVQRVGREFIVRRGHLKGCIVNQAFVGGGEQLGSGTVAPEVQRVLREHQP
jgi:type IV secretion system protein VirB9